MNVSTAFYAGLVMVWLLALATLKLAVERGYVAAAGIVGACVIALVVLTVDIIRSGVPR